MTTTPPPDPSLDPGPPRKTYRRNSNTPTNQSTAQPSQSTRKETTVTTTTQPGKWTVAENIRFVLMGLVAAVAAIATVYATVMANSPAGIQLKLAQEHSKQIAASTPGASISIFGASGPPIAESSNTTVGSYHTPSVPAIPAIVPQTSIIRESNGDIQTIPTVPCGERGPLVTINAGMSYMAQPAPGHRCFGIVFTTPISFAGTNYKLRLAENSDDYISDARNGQSGPVQVDWTAPKAWLERHIGQNIIVEIDDHNNSYGYARFN